MYQFVKYFGGRFYINVSDWIVSAVQDLKREGRLVILGNYLTDL